MRYYDEIDLLKPAYVDDDSSYRYYMINQLDRMLMINKLKRYGFSLSDISKVLNENENKNIINILILHKEKLKNEIDKKKSVIEDIENDIRIFKRTGEFKIMNNEYKITTIKSEDLYLISNREVMSIADYTKIFDKLAKKIEKDKIKSNQLRMSIYHDEEFNPEKSDIELAIIIDDKEKYNRKLEGRLCAFIKHKGAYENLNQAYASIIKWIDENGYEIERAPYEIYLNDPLDVSSEKDLETELYFPIKKK